MRRWISCSRSAASKPRPTAPWFVTTTTGVPVDRSAASDESTPGRNSNSPQLLTWSGRQRLMTPSRSRKTAGVSGSVNERLARGDGDRVLEHGVTILDDAVVVAGHMDDGVGHLEHVAAAEADQADGRRAHQARRADRGDDVGRIAAGADRDHDVAAVEQVGELL